jgi:DNA-binding response OmpR family regulator
MTEPRPGILVVDDDSSMQELFAIVLGRGGFDVLAANTLEDARAFLKGVLPDLILLDLNLDGVDGLAAAQELSEALPAVPVVVVSGSSDPHTRSLALSAGARGFIAKPINPRNFAGEVKRYLEAESHADIDDSDPREQRLRQLREQFLDMALTSIEQLSVRGDEALFADTLLADTAHKWVGASSIEGLPDVEATAREIEVLARARRIDRADHIRDRLRWLEEQFAGCRQ